MLSLDSVRHTAQTAFVESGSGLVFGTAGWISLPDDLYAAVQNTDNPIWLNGGLTARVRQVKRSDGLVALKKALAKCLVHNKDGELSFVNEVLCRSELLQLTEQGSMHPRGDVNEFCFACRGCHRLTMDMRWVGRALG